MSARLSIRSALALAALAAFTVWITWRAKAIELGGSLSERPSPLMGKPAPDFTLETLDGKRVSLADYRGKPLAVTFWASWCGPCRLEMPVLTKLYRQAHGADSNFEILAISIDDSKTDAENAARSMKLPFPVLFDPGGKLSDIYKVYAIPMLFVIDKSGRVASTHTGFQIGIDYILAQQLNLRNYSSTGGR